MENIIWLAIKSGKNSVVPALIGNDQLVEDVNQPRGWWSEHTKRGVICYDMILGIHGIVGNARCLAQCAESLPNRYKLIKYELTNILFMNIYVILWSWENDFVEMYYEHNEKL